MIPQALASMLAAVEAGAVDLHACLEPIVPGLQAAIRTGPSPAAGDPLAPRTHSLPPRVGNGCRWRDGELWDLGADAPAVSAFAVFDRGSNLAAVFGRDGAPLFACEARNNTVRHFQDLDAGWLCGNSVVLNSFAPAPNGVYPLEQVWDNDPASGRNYGSRIIRFAQGWPWRRELWLHGRDHRLDSEIPWNQGEDSPDTRTYGCILLQDPDIVALGQVLRQAAGPVPFVIQGPYAANFRSPAC